MDAKSNIFASALCDVTKVAGYQQFKKTCKTDKRLGKRYIHTIAQSYIMRAFLICDSAQTLSVSWFLLHVSKPYNFNFSPEIPIPQIIAVQVFLVVARINSKPTVFFSHLNQFCVFVMISTLFFFLTELPRRWDAAGFWPNLHLRPVLLPGSHTRSQEQNPQCKQTRVLVVPWRRESCSVSFVLCV